MPYGMDLVNWGHRACAPLAEMTLLAFWGSTDADGHDSAGVFGCDGNENKLLGYAVTLKVDLETLFTNVPVDRVDQNRTGYTAGLYAAWVTNAVVLKISERRDIKIFARRGDEALPEVSSVQ